MATYKNEFEKIEAQEKQLNAQKKQLAKKKKQLKAQLAEEQAENEAKTAESTKQWFIDYCSKFNIDYELDTNYSCGSFLTLAGKSGQKFTEGMDLYSHFESGDEKALKKFVDEFYNQVQAIDALSSILKLSNKYGTDSLEFYTYEISRHGYCAWFNTIYSDIVVYISYYKDLISVRVVYEEGDIRDTTITLANGVELVTEGTGYDSVYMEIQKTVEVKTDQLDTLAKKVEKAVKQVQEITVEDN
jgi:hypothetical protein